MPRQGGLDSDGALQFGHPRWHLILKFLTCFNCATIVVVVVVVAAAVAVVANVGFHPLGAGALSANLGPGKSFFMKMSLRARKTFDDWASKIPGVISAPPTASAARSLHYCIVLGTIYKSLQLTPAPQGTTNLDAGTTPNDRESHVLRWQFPGVMDALGLQGFHMQGQV